MGGVHRNVFRERSWTPQVLAHEGLVPCPKAHSRRDFTPSDLSIQSWSRAKAGRGPPARALHEFSTGREVAFFVARSRSVGRRFRAFGRARRNSASPERLDRRRRTRARAARRAQPRSAKNTSRDDAGSAPARYGSERSRERGDPAPFQDAATSATNFGSGSLECRAWSCSALRDVANCCSKRAVS